MAHDRQRQNKSFIAAKGKDRMAQIPRWQNRTIYQPDFQEHGLYVLTGIAHVNRWKAYWEVFAYERV